MENLYHEVDTAAPEAAVFPRPSITPKGFDGKPDPMTPAELGTAREKLDVFRGGIVLYRRLRTIMEGMDCLMPFNGIGARNSSSFKCILITGPAHCGKTTLLSHYASRYEEYFFEKRRIIPILVVSLPSDCSKRSLAIAVLRALKVPEAVATTGSLDTLTARVRNNLEKQGVQLLILDEFHHLLNSQNADVLMAAAEYVKTILNMRICSIAMCGIESAAKIFDATGQLDERCIAHFKIEPLRWDIDEERDIFCAILEQLEAHFPLKLEASLTSEGMAWRLHMLSKGKVGRVSSFLDDVARFAFVRGLKVVGYDLFLEVAQNKGGKQSIADDLDQEGADTCWLNPFALEDAELRVASKPREKTKLRRGKRGIKPADVL